jgi:hypothetical protein
VTNRSDTLFSALIDDLNAQGLHFLGEPKDAKSLKDAAACSLFDSFLKKFRVENSKDADRAALDKFLQSNEKCKNWTLPSGFSEHTYKHAAEAYDEELLNDFKSIVHDFWYRGGQPLVDHPFDLLKEGKVGPGANVGALGGDFYTKLFSSPLTCSDISLYNWYRRYIWSLPEWSIAETIREIDYGSASVVVGSKLSYVPKNDKISRCICVEPTLNTYFQLGLATHLNLRLSERFGIALEDQQVKNRELACLGSLTDGLSTIDLSSASDSISLKMLEWCLPRDFYLMLVKYRCKVVEIKGQGSVELHMVSTMGNGYTFPLQTMLFSAAVAACFRARGIPANRSTSATLWGVNGDDIVVPSEITSDVIRLLGLLGFSVNSDKTFVKGPFRESCGADFFLGTNIRGVYIKELDSLGSLFSAVNRLVRFSTRTGIDLHRTVACLMDWIHRPHYVPRWANSDSGIHAPLRWANPDYDRSSSSHLYESWEPVATRISFSSNGDIVVPRRHKIRSYNPPGLLICFVQGSVQGGKIGVRDDDQRYCLRRRTTARWDDDEWDPRIRAQNMVGYRLTGRPDRAPWIEDHRPPVDPFTGDYGLDWSEWESTFEHHIAYAMRGSN